MNITRAFTVDKVGWHTGVSGNPESRAATLRRFRVVAEFLQANSLTLRDILKPDQIVDDGFAIMSSDLTSEGLQVLKEGYDPWLKAVVNMNRDINDLSILYEAMRWVRSK